MSRWRRSACGNSSSISSTRRGAPACHAHGDPGLADAARESLPPSENSNLRESFAPFRLSLWTDDIKPEKEGAMTDRVLVIGATGHVGRHLVHAFRRNGHDVLLLLRPDAPKGWEGERSILIESLVRQGATTFEGNLEDPLSLERACAEVDAVVSCIDHRPDHLKLQVALGRAATKSGRVKRIIPSQFGMDSRSYKQSRVDHGDTKRELQQEFDGCGVPITYIHVNGLATYWAASLGQLGLKAPPSEEVDFYGEGDVKFSMITPEDVARYTARAVFDPGTANRHTLISPPENRLSQKELIAIWEARTKSRLRRRIVPARELDERIATLAHQPDKLAELSFLQLIRAAWIDGLGDGRRRPDVLELTERYPDIGYDTIPQYLERFVSLSEAAE
jgi:uncharacterized protein YbjT (DUF2867 family)